MVLTVVVRLDASSLLEAQQRRAKITGVKTLVAPLVVAPSLCELEVGEIGRRIRAVRCGDSRRLGLGLRGRLLHDLGLPEKRERRAVIEEDLLTGANRSVRTQRRHARQQLQRDTAPERHKRQEGVVVGRVVVGHRSTTLQPLRGVVALGMKQSVLACVHAKRTVGTIRSHDRALATSKHACNARRVGCVRPCGCSHLGHPRCQRRTANRRRGNRSPRCASDNACSAAAHHLFLPWPRPK